MNVDGSSGRLAVAKPLYVQVRDILFERIRSREWSVAETLPNEFALASEFGVSIGTVRRAVELLESAGVVVRRQGRGTFIVRPDPATVSRRFSALRNSSGAPIELHYTNVFVSRRAPTAFESDMFEIDGTCSVIAIEQQVHADATVRGHEWIVVPADLLPDVEHLSERDWPNMLRQRLGSIITRADDMITVCAAQSEEAKLLSISTAAPILHLERRSSSIDGRVVQFKTAKYYCPDAYYRSTISTDGDEWAA